MLEEIWRDIPNYEGFYQASSLGRIRSVDRLVKGKKGCIYKKKGKIIKFRTNWNGYYNVQLVIDKKKKVHDVHRLIAKTLIPNPENKPQVNHKWGNKKDNRVVALEWVTREENMQHAHRSGLMRLPIGRDHKLSKLNEEQVAFIRNNPELSLFFLAEKFHVSSAAIRLVRIGKNWKHTGGKFKTSVSNKKLTEEDVIEIRRIYSETELSQKHIAEMFSVRPNSISQIITGTKWKNVGGIINRNNRIGKRRYYNKNVRVTTNNI